MNFLSSIFGCRKVQLDDDSRNMAREIEHQRTRIKQSTQVIASGSRVMQSMAGMMQLLNINDKVDPDRHGQ